MQTRSERGGSVGPGGLHTHRTRLRAITRLRLLVSQCAKLVVPPQTTHIVLKDRSSSPSGYPMVLAGAVGMKPSRPHEARESGLNV
jgi:hypothetical protein